MSTTIMRNSSVGDAWIREMCALNPPTRVVNEKGELTGDITSGPVRLVFCDSVFTAKPQMRTKPDSPLKHATGVLFPPFVDFSLFWEEYYMIAAKDFGDHYNKEFNMYTGIDNPIFDQKEKLKYDGFTPGCMSMNVSSNFRPTVVDTRMLPITDEKAIYPGVWAILSTNAYASGKQTPRKGPRFGLQMLMKIADDTSLAGGAGDPRQNFGKVQVRAPIAVSAAQFKGPGAPPPPGSAAGAYYPPPPSGGVPNAAYVPASPPPLGNGEEDLSQFA